MELLLEDISVPIFLLQCVLFYLLIRKIKNNYLIRPIILVSLFLLFYPIVGLMNLKVSQIFAGWYKMVDPYEAYLVSSIGTMLLLFSFVPYRNKMFVSKVKAQFIQDNLYQWIKWGTIIGLFLNCFNFISVGGIPIFWSNLTGRERFELADRFFYSRFFFINSTILALNIIYLGKRYKPWKMNIIYTAINIVVSASIGSRHLVMLPVMIAFIFLAYTKKQKNKTLIFYIIGVSLLLYTMQIFRGDGYSLDFFQFLFSFGGEYRDYILLRDHFNFTDFRHGQTILPIITNIIPKQIYALFGLDKADYSIYSAYIAQDIWGADTGIRTGIWGEFFMNWGDIGVIFGLLIYGFVVAKTDYFLQKFSFIEPKLLFFSFIYTLILFAIPGSWATIGDTLQSYGVTFFILMKLLKSEENDRQAANYSTLIPE